jgi:hypothetical protein
MTFGDLPAINACLNGASALFLGAGYVLIRQGRWRAHRGYMLAAFVTSTLFLTRRSAPPKQSTMTPGQRADRNDSIPERTPTTGKPGWSIVPTHATAKPVKSPNGQ